MPMHARDRPARAVCWPSAASELSERGTEVNEATWDRIERSRERWNVLRHPFYRRWSAGELTAEELARYSGQYRHAVEAIATMSAAAADSLPDRPRAAPSRGRGARAPAALGRVRQRLGGDASDAADGRDRGVRARLDGADDGVAATLARLYAIESGQPEISSTKREGLLERYGFDDGEGTAYFRIHETRDVEHAAEVRELIAEIAGETPTRTRSWRRPNPPSAPTGGCSTESRQAATEWADAVTSCSASSWASRSGSRSSPSSSSSSARTPSTRPRSTRGRADGTSRRAVGLDVR